MSSNKRIVFISPGFPADEQDSVCIPPLQAYVRELKQDHPNTDLIVVALHYPKENRSYEWKEVPVISLNGARFGKLLKPLLWIRVHRLLKKLHARHPIDVVHSFWLNDTTLFARRFCKKNKVRHVATLMGQDAFASNRYLSWMDLPELKLVALSDHAANQLRLHQDIRKPAVIPWGIDPPEWRGHTLSSRRYEENDILSVASLIRVKQPDIFIDIISEIRRSMPSIKSMIVGIGPMTQGIIKRIQREGLSEACEIKGSIPREDVLHLMRRSKVLLHTASYEGQGYVFLEALSAGLPIVTFDVGFLPGHKLVHICRNKEEMVAVVQDILNDPGNHEPAFPVTIQDTVNAYWKIYN